MNRNRPITFSRIALILVLIQFCCFNKGFGNIITSLPALQFHNGDEFVNYFMSQEARTIAPELKSKTNARIHSVAFTVVPLALARLNARGYRLSEQSGTSILLITPALLMGPSAGSIYADDWTLAKRSILIRLASSALLVSGHFIRQDDDYNSLGLSLFFSGSLLLASHALYDIVILSAHSVDYYNATIEMRTGITLQNNLPNEWDYSSSESIPNKAILQPRLTFRINF